MQSLHQNPPESTGNSEVINIYQAVSPDQNSQAIEVVEAEPYYANMPSLEEAV